LYPFHWSHVYLPVVPSPLLDLFEAPVPFILGTHSSWIHLIPKECLQDVIIIDCDLATIDLGSNKIPGFPASVDRWLVTASKLILYPEYGEQELTSPTPIYPFVLEEFIPSDVTPTHFMFQMLFFDTMVNMLRFVPQCIFFLGPAHPVFNRPLFLEKFTNSEFLPFMESLTDTNGFHQFIDSLNSPELFMFMEGVRLVNSEDARSHHRSRKPDDITVHFENVRSSSNPNADEFKTDGAKALIFSRHGNSSTKDNIYRFSDDSYEHQHSRAYIDNRHHNHHRHHHFHHHRRPTAADVSVFPSWVTDLIVCDSHSVNSHDHEHAVILHRVPMQYPYFNFMLRNILKLRASRYVSIFQSVQQRHIVEVAPADPAANIGSNSSSDAGSTVQTVTWKERVIDIYVDCDPASSHLHPTEEESPVGDHVEPYFQSMEKRYSPHYESDVRLTSEAFAPKTPKFADGISPRNSPKLFQRGQGPVDGTNPDPNNAAVTRYSPRNQFLTSKENFVKKQRASISPTIAGRSFHSNTFSAYGGASASTEGPAIGKDLISPRNPPLSSRFKKSKSIYEVDNSGKAAPLGTARSTSSKMTSAKDSARDASSSIFTFPSRDIGDSEVAVNANAKSGDSSADSSATSMSMSKNEDQLSSSILTTVLAPSGSNESLDALADDHGVGHRVRGRAGRSKAASLSIDAEIAYSVYVQPSDSVDTVDSLTKKGPSFPLVFDEECLRIKLSAVEPWTLWRLCAVIGADVQQTEQAYKTIITPRPDDANSFLRLQRLSPRDSAAQMLSTVNHIRHLPEAFTEEGASIAIFFQSVITSSQQIEEVELSHLLDKCATALESSALRKSLMDVLYNKSAGRTAGSGFGSASASSASASFNNTPLLSSAPPSVLSQTSQAGPGASFTDLCQLHTAAFEALATLFSTILQICTRHRDYLNAFALLEVSGRFFCVKTSNRTSAGAAAASEPIEMLSARVCQHPIYQSSLFWRAVMNERLPMQTNVPHRSHLPPTAEMAKSVIFEAHNILHFMHNIGVNSERSLLFIQAIARDYQLDLNLYYELQRFTNSMWGVSDSSSTAIGALSGGSAAGSMSKHDYFDAEGNVVKQVAERTGSEAILRHSSISSMVHRTNSTGNMTAGFQADHSSAAKLTISANYMQNPDDSPSKSLTVERFAARSRSGSGSEFGFSDPSTYQQVLPSPDSQLSEPSPSQLQIEQVQTPSPFSSEAGSVNSSPTSKSVKFNIPDVSATPPSAAAPLQQQFEPSPGGQKTPNSYWGNIKSMFGRKPSVTSMASTHSAADNVSLSAANAAAVFADPTHTASSFSSSSSTSDHAQGDPSQNLQSLQLPSRRSLNRALSTVSDATSSNSSPTRSPLTPFNEVSYATKMFDQHVSSYEPVQFEDLNGVITTSIDTHDGWLVTGTSEGNIGIMDMHSGRLVSCQTHSSATSYSSSAQTSISQVGKGAKMTSSESYEGVTQVQFVRNGNCFVTGCSNGILNVWSLPGRLELSDSEEENTSSSAGATSTSSSATSFGSLLSSFSMKPSLKKKNNWTIRRKKYNITSIRVLICLHDAVLLVKLSV
jgi:hypothetical protein